MAIVLEAGLFYCNALGCRGFENSFHFYKLRAGVAFGVMVRAVAVDTFRGAERFRRVGFTAFFAADRGLAASGGRVTKEPAFSTSERDRERLLDAKDHGGDFNPVWEFGGEGQSDGFRQDFGVAFNGKTFHVDDVLISESGQDLIFFLRDRDPV